MARHGTIHPSIFVTDRLFCQKIYIPLQNAVSKILAYAVIFFKVYRHVQENMAWKIYVEISKIPFVHLLVNICLLYTSPSPRDS